MEDNMIFPWATPEDASKTIKEKQPHRSKKKNQEPENVNINLLIFVVW